MEVIVCKRCGSVNDYRTEQAGPHIKAICNGCNLYIKFVSQAKESSVQDKIIKHLEKCGWWVTKILQSTTNGIPDLLAIRKGRVVFIETKRPGIKKADPLQEYIHQQIREQNIEVVSTADSLESIQHLEHYEPINESGLRVH